MNEDDRLPAGLDADAAERRVVPTGRPFTTTAALGIEFRSSVFRWWRPAMRA